MFDFTTVNVINDKTVKAVQGRTLVTCNTGRTGQRSTGPCWRGGAGPLRVEGGGRAHQENLWDDPPVRGLSPRPESLVQIRNL